MLHDLPDTASTLQSGTSEETWSGSKEERRERERESSRRSFSEDAEMLSNDRAAVTAASREQQPLHKQMQTQPWDDEEDGLDTPAWVIRARN